MMRFNPSGKKKKIKKKTKSQILRLILIMRFYV